MTQPTRRTFLEQAAGIALAARTGSAFAAGETAVNLQHIYHARGRQRIKLTVLDEDGGRSVYRVAVRVGETD